MADGLPELLQQLESIDPQVRGTAALGLARLNDPRAPQALADTINDLPNLLHYPYTQAVQALIAMGDRALPVVAPLLQSPDPITRTRAWLVLRSVVQKRPGVGPWQALWLSLGRYAPEGDAASRAAAAEQWRVWVEQNAGSG